MPIKTLALILGLIGLFAGFSQHFEGGSEGAQQSYYANGHVKESASYLDYRRHGLCQRFYKDGTPRAEGQFDHGRMVGEWTWWTPEGEVDRERSGYYVAGRKSDSSS